MKKMLGSALTCAMVATLALAGSAHAYYPPDEDPTAAADGGPTCGSGTKTFCASRTTQKCIEWKTTSLTTGFSTPAGASLGVTISCAVWETTVQNYFYP